MQTSSRVLTTQPFATKRARYEGKVYDVLYSTGGAIVLSDVGTGDRLTVPRRKLVFIK